MSDSHDEGMSLLEQARVTNAKQEARANRLFFSSLVWECLGTMFFTLVSSVSVLSLGASTEQNSFSAMSSTHLMGTTLASSLAYAVLLQANEVLTKSLRTAHGEGRGTFNPAITVTFAACAYFRDEPCNTFRVSMTIAVQVLGAFLAGLVVCAVVPWVLA